MPKVVRLHGLPPKPVLERTKPPPKHLGAPEKALWRELIAKYRFDDAALVILGEALTSLMRARRCREGDREGGRGNSRPVRGADAAPTAHRRENQQAGFPVSDEGAAPRVRIMSRRLPPREAAAGLSDVTWAFLHDQAPPPDCGYREDFEFWMLERDQADLTLLGLSQEALWQPYGADVLRWWVQAKPGTRPSLWWKFRAPEARLRLGGSGEPDALRDMRCGVPTVWVRPVRGDYQGGRELCYDSDDPPLYESEPAFLRRHELLLPSERRRLTPADYKPVPITEILGLGQGAAEPADAL
jgi:hypothetical protein